MVHRNSHQKRMGDSARSEVTNRLNPPEILGSRIHQTQAQQIVNREHNSWDILYMHTGFNTLETRQNCSYFADYTFKRIFLNEIVNISIHRSPMNSPHKGQWRGALMFFLSAPEQLSKQPRRRWFENVMHNKQNTAKLYASLMRSNHFNPIECD